MASRVSSWQQRLAAGAAAVGLSVLCFGSTARAVELWYDGFDLGPGQYTPGTILGQFGGTGTFFATDPVSGLGPNPWLQAGGDDALVLPTSLTKPGQVDPSIGGSLGDSDTDTCCITSRVSRLFSQPWSGRSAPVGTFYMGYLVNFGTGPTLHHRVVEMHDADLGDGNRNFQLGYSEFTGVGPGLALKVKNSDGLTNPEITQSLSPAVDFATDGMTHCVVVRFDLANEVDSDRIRVYLDPMGLTEPAVANADIGSINFLADRMGGVTNFVFGAGTASVFDELRVGTAFEDVACMNIPEPATLCLAGLCALGLVVLRRQRAT